MSIHRLRIICGVVALLGVAYAVNWVHAAAPDKTKKSANRTALEAAARLWEPKQRARDYHSVGILMPTNAPPTVYALSFSTSQPFEEAWNFFAAQCGATQKFTATNFLNLSGQSQSGSYIVLDRFEGGQRRETVFGLRTKDHTVTATLRPGNGDRASAGSIVVVF